MEAPDCIARIAQILPKNRPANKIHDYLTRMVKIEPRSALKRRFKQVKALIGRNIMHTRTATPLLPICLLLCCLLPALAWGQASGQLAGLNLERLQLNRQGMTVLGGWAIGNMGYSGIRYFGTTGRTRAFHQMNVMWNVVNLGIAGLGYLGSSPASADNLGLAASVAEQAKMEKILLFNAGLDVGYIFGGLYLRERAQRAALKWQDRFHGWGNSLVLQGGFLLAFDISLFLLHNHQGAGLHQLLETVQVGPTGLQLSFRF
jgi:hypothetical protein